MLSGLPYSIGVSDEHRTLSFRLLIGVTYFYQHCQILEIVNDTKNVISNNTFNLCKKSFKTEQHKKNNPLQFYTRNLFKS